MYRKEDECVCMFCVCVYIYPLWSLIGHNNLWALQICQKLVKRRGSRALLHFKWLRSTELIYRIFMTTGRTSKS